MATTGTKTVMDIVKYALRKSGHLGFGEDAPAEDAEVAVDELNLMLKGWQNMEYNLWTKTRGSQALTTGAAQTLDPVRPLRILSARYKGSATASEIPMFEMTRQEYDELPDKSTTGTPTQFYYDRQREAARLYVWPVISAATGQTIEYSYERELEDVTSLNDTLDMPGEWWEAVGYNLAARMQETAPTSGTSPNLFARAQMLLQQAGAFDREGSVYFGRSDDQC